MVLSLKTLHKTLMKHSLSHIGINDSNSGNLWQFGNNKRPDVKHVITYIFPNKKYNKCNYDLQLFLLLLSEAKAIVTQAPTIKEINKWASSLKHRNSNRTNYLWTFVCMYICIYIYMYFNAGKLKQQAVEHVSHGKKS